MDAGQTEPPKEQAVSERELELLNKPAVTECPSCGHEGMTRVEKEGSGLANFGKNTGRFILGIATGVGQPVLKRRVAHHCRNCNVKIATGQGVLSRGVGAEGLRGGFY